ncbi:hypothetical protein LINGRAHAP2_LOCUS28948 [Linum grandiflorum]
MIPNPTTFMSASHRAWCFPFRISVHAGKFFFFLSRHGFGSFYS